MKNMQNWEVHIYDGRKYGKKVGLTKVDALELFDRLAQETSRNIHNMWISNMRLFHGDVVMAEMVRDGNSYTYYIRVRNKADVYNTPYDCVEGYECCEWIRRGCGTRKKAMAFEG